MQDNIRKICQKTLLIAAFAGCMGCSSAQETTASATIAQRKPGKNIRSGYNYSCSCREHDSRCGNSCTADQCSGKLFVCRRNNSCCV